MPNIATTLHQVLRYFFVGTFAVFWCAFLLDCGADASHLKAVRVAKRLADPVAAGGWIFLAPFIVGAFIYCLHRAAIYPAIHRFVVYRVAAGPALGRLWPWWPWGRVTDVDLNLQVAFWMPQGGAERERFIGWASELHLLYVAVEIVLASFVWPGWERALETCWAKAVLAFAVFGIGWFTWAWDLQLVQLERRTAELMGRTVVSPQAAPAPK